MSEDAPPPYLVNATGHCAFCGVEAARTAWSSPLALAVWDLYPVSLGHALVVPRRHVASWSELKADEKAALTEGLDADPLINVGETGWRLPGKDVNHLTAPWYAYRLAKDNLA